MDVLIKYAMCFVGLPYRWGGDDAINGFDCSGFAQEVLASVGMDPKGDQTAHGLYLHFKKTGERESQMRGSLCFFGTSEVITSGGSWNRTKITHVGLAIDSWRMIEAGGGGSNTTSKEQAAKHNAFIRIRPISSRSDLVEAILPPYDTQELFS